MEKRWAFPLITISLICIILLGTSFNMGLISYTPTTYKIFLHHQSPPSSPPLPAPEPGLPRFAYLISGSKGDSNKLWRTLRALYHPRNQYIVHMDLKSSKEERLKLAKWIENDKVYENVGNVYMVKKANMVTYRGPTMVSNTLHACAILLKRKRNDWDWFINLSASDYPLVTQDDLIYTFSKLNRSLNFIGHTSQLGWKAAVRAMPVVVDPGLYSANKADLFWTTPKKSLPTTFKLFTGSAWVVLSQSFVEYLIVGWDNLPRTLLMYYTNIVSSPEFYFHTVICNVPEFAQTVANHDLHYIAWDVPPKQHPRTLNSSDLARMISIGAAFARKFRHNDPVLDKIDQELLGRRNGSFTRGGWCDGEPPCARVGDLNKIQPGPGVVRLGRLVDRLVSPNGFRNMQCN